MDNDLPLGLDTDAFCYCWRVTCAVYWFAHEIDDGLLMMMKLIKLEVIIFLTWLRRFVFGFECFKFQTVTLYAVQKLHTGLKKKKKEEIFSEIPNESDTIITSHVFKLGRFSVKFGILFDLSRLFCCTVNLVTSFGYDICIYFNLLQMWNDLSYLWAIFVVFFYGCKAQW